MVTHTYKDQGVQDTKDFKKIHEMLLRKPKKERERFARAWICEIMLGVNSKVELLKKVEKKESGARKFLNEHMAQIHALNKLAKANTKVNSPLNVRSLTRKVSLSKQKGGQPQAAIGNGRNSTRRNASSSVGIFGNILKAALLATLVASGILASQVGNGLQVRTYESWVRTQNAITSQIPQFISGDSTEMYTKVPLFTPEVAQAVIKETVDFDEKSIKAEPVKKLIKDLHTLEMDYMKHAEALTTAISSSMNDMKSKSWFKNYRSTLNRMLRDIEAETMELSKSRPTERSYFTRASGHQEKVEEFEGKYSDLVEASRSTDTALDMLEKGDISEILKACKEGGALSAELVADLKNKISSANEMLRGQSSSDHFSVKIKYLSDSAATIIGMKANDYKADYVQIDNLFNTHSMDDFEKSIVELIRNTVKERSIQLRLASIETAISTEMGRDLLTSIENGFKQGDEIIGDIVSIVPEMNKSCRGGSTVRGCEIITELEELPETLRHLNLRNFHLPKSEKLLDLIIRTNSLRNPKFVTLKELMLMKDIEEFKRNPNVWITTIAVSVGVTLATFVASIVFGLGYIGFVGVIKTGINIAGTVESISGRVRESAELGQLRGREAVLAQRLRIGQMERELAQIADAPGPRQLIAPAPPAEVSLERLELELPSSMVLENGPVVARNPNGPLAIANGRLTANNLR